MRAVIRFICVLVFIVCLAFGGLLIWAYVSQDKEYESLANNRESLEIGNEANMNPATLVDWDYLRATNSDTIGWIMIPDSRVDYPIVQTTNNTRYIKTNFFGETNYYVSPGAIFLDCNAHNDFSSQNSVLYGHNMNDGSMFHTLELFLEKSYFDAHSIIYVITPQHLYELQPLALNEIHASETSYVQASFGNTEELHSYIQKFISESLVTIGTEKANISQIERVVTLCTCDNNSNDYRYLLLCSIEEIM